MKNKKTPVNVVKGKKGFQKTKPVQPAQIVKPPHVKNSETVAAKTETGYASSIIKFENRYIQDLFYRQVGEDAHDPSSYVIHKISHMASVDVMCEPGWITEEEYTNRMLQSKKLQKIYREEKTNILNQQVKKARKRLKIARIFEIVTYAAGSTIFGAVSFITPESMWIALIPLTTAGYSFTVSRKAYVAKQEKLLNEAETELKSLAKEIQPNMTVINIPVGTTSWKNTKEDKS